jgi:surfactin synthase thioesterase subunit
MGAAQVFVGDEATDDLVDAVRAAIGIQPPAALVARLHAVLTTDAAEALARCAAPITYLRGTADRVVTEASVAEVERVASGRVNVVRLSGPHLLLQAAPEQAWQAIMDAAGLASSSIRT